MGIVLNQSLKNTIITYIGFGIGGISTIFLFPSILGKTYYGLSNYGGSPLITHYTQVKVNYGECFCGNDNVKYESFGIIATIGGLTEVTGYKLDDCSFSCP